MFHTLLIANRGEIACRIAATARRMGIRTVAVYSDADANARHVAACDAAVHIGGAAARDSYLRADAILQAAKATGAQAIHPGYGFLSENADFARACAETGIVFVGPPAQAIAAMGDKSSAKALMETAGVPLTPGYHGANQAPGFLQAQADAIGYPVLIKASAGGGGKGMRVVEAAADFAAALASCQREAAASFGSDHVLIERYLQRPRHVEIQVFADSHGNCVYLFERDCSVQRRHQKVLEEAPAPGMTQERRTAMGEAAVAAAKAVGYVGAGTVEFIAEQDGRFYFMEMNTRLQVEHPVTELITGLDLVQWQLCVAAGQPLPLRQEDLTLSGHAIEARIYAENPERDFLPSTGTLCTLIFPPHAAFAHGAVRIDGGVRQGDAISPYYDPMIAKVMAHGADREEARKRLLQALVGIRATGVATNVAFLQRLLNDEAFATADLDTGLIARRHEALFPAAQPAPVAVLALAAAACLARQGWMDSDKPALASDPWALSDGWRVAGSFSQTLTLREGDAQHVLTLQRQDAAWTLLVAQTHDPAGWDQALQDSQNPPPRALRWQTRPIDGDAAQFDPSAATDWRMQIRLWLDATEHQASVIASGARLSVFLGDTVWTLDVFDELQHSAQTEDDAHAGHLTAPMPGKIIAVHVKAGDAVKRGDAILVMEAMKMEHTLTATQDGKVQEVCYGLGEQVAEGAELVVLAE